MHDQDEAPGDERLVGLLLAPQGIGAALAMPVAGVVTDRIGARAVVTVGTALALVGTLAYTQLGAETSHLSLSVSLLALGLGIGSTIMPSMAAAFRRSRATRRREPRAPSTPSSASRAPSERRCSPSCCSA